MPGRNQPWDELDWKLLGSVLTWKCLRCNIYNNEANNGSHIWLQLNNSITWINSTHYTLANPYNDIPAERVIYVSCSVGRIRAIDLDTKHYAYSITDELEEYGGKVWELPNGEYEVEEIYGWAVFFLDFIKAGMDWDQAEIEARRITNEMKANGTI